MSTMDEIYPDEDCSSAGVEPSFTEALILFLVLQSWVYKGCFKNTE